VLDPVVARPLLDSIDMITSIRPLDRVLIVPMVFSLARIRAALAMRVKDV
jgi:hypothetical protein